MKVLMILTIGFVTGYSKSYVYVPIGGKEPPRISQGLK